GEGEDQQGQNSRISGQGQPVCSGPRSVQSTPCRTPHNWRLRRNFASTVLRQTSVKAGQSRRCKAPRSTEVCPREGRECLRVSEQGPPCTENQPRVLRRGRASA